MSAREKLIDELRSLLSWSVDTGCLAHKIGRALVEYLESNPPPDVVGVEVAAIEQVLKAARALDDYDYDNERTREFARAIGVLAGQAGLKP